ncbi:MAG: hypothetical protein DRP50_00865 [Thermotoga sp.]|nr:MAG: hypothetical protein DRP50_00865 [Thermotoga sp.]
MMNEVIRITITGMLIVFSGLTITSLIIYIFGRILNRAAGKGHVHIRTTRYKPEEEPEDIKVVIAAAVSAILGEGWKVTKVKKAERTRHLSRWKRMRYETWEVKRHKKVSI